MPTSDPSPGRARSLWRWVVLGPALLLTLLATGCPGTIVPLRPELQAAADRRDALGLSEQLERLIDQSTVTDDDREAAYAEVQRWTAPTAEYAFARAALAGRLAQVRGLSAIALVGEVESWALESIKLDPKFQQEAATRMLGTLYVMAPSSMVTNGDSEKGLEMLEKLCQRHPEKLENHLRVAEAYVALGDAEPAFVHLCRCERERSRLRPSDQRVLDKVVQDAGGSDALRCPRASPSAAPAPSATVPTAAAPAAASAPPLDASAPKP
jgi:hypothetical protein